MKTFKIYWYVLPATDSYRFLLIFLGSEYSIKIGFNPWKFHNFVCRQFVLDTHISNNISRSNITNYRVLYELSLLIFLSICVQHKSTIVFHNLSSRRPEQSCSALSKIGQICYLQFWLYGLSELSVQ